MQGLVNCGISLNRRDTAINASTGVSVMAIEFLENHFW
jgi:hypothetical protein